MPVIKIINQGVETFEAQTEDFDSSVISLDGALTFSAQVALDDTTPAAITVEQGASQITEVTPVNDTGAKESTTIQVVADTGALERSTVTTIADTGSFAMSQVIFPPTAELFQAEYVVIFDQLGTSYAYWVDIDDNGLAPTGATYTSADVKTRLDITTGNSAATNGTIFYDAALITMDNVNLIDNLSGGVTIEHTLLGLVTSPEGYLANGTIGGNIIVNILAPGTNSNLKSKYFTLGVVNSAGALADAYVWFRVSGQGVDPNVPGFEDVVVNIGASDSAEQVSTALTNALNTQLNTYVSATNLSTVVTITSLYFGNVTHIADGPGGSATTMTFATTTDGNVSNLNSTYFTYDTPTELNYGWYNIGNQGVDPGLSVPALSGKTGREIIANPGVSAPIIASATVVWLSMDENITVSAPPASDTVTITNNTMGPVTDAANGTAPHDPVFIITVVTQGSSSNVNSTYWTLNSVGDVVQYYIWYSVNGEGTDPAVIGKTGLEVGLSPGASAATIASSTKTAIDASASANFTTIVVSNTLTVTTSVRGDATNAANGLVSASFGIVTSQEGILSAIDTTDNEIDYTSHGFGTGLEVLIGSDGTLPAPLVGATDYYVIRVDADHFKLATSHANAVAGTFIDITNQGSENSQMTLTPSSVTSSTIQLQVSNDGTTWSNVGSPATISGDEVEFFEIINPSTVYARISFGIEGGQLTATNTYVVKGPN